MSIFSLCSKALGLTTAGLVFYDAHKNGMTNATMHAKKNLANTMVDHYVQSNQITKLSSVEANAKKAWFRFLIDSNIMEPIDATVGYISGAIGSIVNDVIPAALATGAILCGKKAPKVGKVCGLGLLAYGLKYMLFDVMSIGKRDYLKHDV